MNIWQQSRPSPVADLIRRHRAEEAEIYRKHAYELAHPRPYASPYEVPA